MKDMTETKIHHVLSENLFMPRARPRRMSYSRHAMDEKDLSFNHDINYKVHMQVRRMITDNQLRRRKGQKESNNTNQMRVSGSSKQLRDDHVHKIIKEVVHDGDQDYSRSSDDDDGGICFTPKPGVANGIINPAYMKDISEKSDEESDDNEDQPSLKADLPWKRETDQQICIAPVKQREFPTWINNQEYINYGSPSEVFMGDTHSTEPQHVAEFYDRRDSSSSFHGSNSRRSSEHRIKPPTIYKRRDSQNLTVPEGHLFRVNFEDETNR